MIELVVTFIVLLLVLGLLYLIGKAIIDATGMPPIAHTILYILVLLVLLLFVLSWLGGGGLGTWRLPR